MSNDLLLELVSKVTSLPQQHHRALCTFAENGGYSSLEEWCDCSPESAGRYLKDLYDLGFIVLGTHGCYFQPDMVRAIANGIHEIAPDRRRSLRPYRIVAGHISYERRHAILERDDFTCVYCGYEGSRLDLGLDHVIPRALGGLTREDNLATCCWPCNAEKRDLPLDDFLRARLFTTIASFEILASLCRGRVLPRQDFLLRSPRTLGSPAFPVLRLQLPGAASRLPSGLSAVRL